MTGKATEIYKYLEPLYNDYRKLAYRSVNGWELIRMDEFIDMLLYNELACDVALPFLPKRLLLEDSGMMEPRKSILEDEIEDTDDDNKEILPTTEKKKKKPVETKSPAVQSDQKPQAPSTNTLDDKNQEKIREMDKFISQQITSATKDTQVSRPDSSTENIDIPLKSPKESSKQETIEERKGERRRENKDEDKDRDRRNRDRSRERPSPERNRDRSRGRSDRDRDRPKERSDRDRSRERTRRRNKSSERRSRDRSRDRNSSRRSGRSREKERRRDRSRDRRRSPSTSSRSQSRSPDKKYKNRSPSPKASSSKYRSVEAPPPPPKEDAKDDDFDKLQEGDEQYTINPYKFKYTAKKFDKMFGKKSKPPPIATTAVPAKPTAPEEGSVEYWNQLRESLGIKKLTFGGGQK